MCFIRLATDRTGLAAATVLQNCSAVSGNFKAPDKNVIRRSVETRKWAVFCLELFLSFSLLLLFLYFTLVFSTTKMTQSNEQKINEKWADVVAAQLLWLAENRSRPKVHSLTTFCAPFRYFFTVNCTSCIRRLGIRKRCRQLDKI